MAMQMLEQLSVYVSDHLAGATAALERLDALIESPPTGADVASLAELRAEIGDERKRLEDIAARLPKSDRYVRQAAAWVSEKGLALKLKTDASTSAFALFESLEALSVGVAGKRLLWRLLRDRVVALPVLVGPNYTKLIEQSTRQRRVIETMRLAAGRLLWDAGDAEGVATTTSATAEKRGSANSGTRDAMGDAGDVGVSM
jgi:hypothetical protein